jgi:peptide/nickel transport system substrate-binding protein
MAYKPRVPAARIASNKLRFQTRRCFHPRPDHKADPEPALRHHRRTVLKALAATTVAGLAAPRIVRADAATTLRYVPRFDPGVLDPHWSTSGSTRTHGFMVYDTLYGLDDAQQPQFQMLQGHVIEDDGLRWTLTLRPGLRFHDDTPVLARDCTASIRRWAGRDLFGQELMAATDDLSAPDDNTIVFRLKRKFPLLPMALGKSQGAAPLIIPERIIAASNGKPVAERIGSGPFRFVAGDYVPGSFLAYEKFTGYVPRADGTPSGTAGPKRVYFDRVTWRVIPDANTGLAALRSDEVDWLEYLLPDLVASVAGDKAIAVKVMEPHGYIAILRLNHLQPPFDNPAIRRALLGAIDQDELMQGMVGDYPAYRHTPVGVFCPGTPMANDAGMAVFTSKRDYAAVRAAVQAAGYEGEPVAMLMVSDIPQYRGVNEVLADQMKRAGFNIDYQAMDFTTVVSRRENRGPVDKGGWNGFVTNGWYGTDMLTPVTHTSLRGNGAKGWAGWPDSPKLEALRRQWMDTTDPAEQKRIAVEMQLQCWIDVPYIPLGQNMQPSAYRSELVDFLPGFSTFWNVRRS